MQGITDTTSLFYLCFFPGCPHLCLWWRWCQPVPLETSAPYWSSLGGWNEEGDWIEPGHVLAQSRLGCTGKGRWPTDGKQHTRLLKVSKANTVYLQFMRQHIQKHRGKYDWLHSRHGYKSPCPTQPNQEPTDFYLVCCFLFIVVQRVQVC